MIGRPGEECVARPYPFCGNRRGKGECTTGLCTQDWERLQGMCLHFWGESPRQVELCARDGAVLSEQEMWGLE